MRVPLAERPWGLVLVLGALGIAAALLWLAAGAPRDATLARIQREGSIRIGYAVEAPYAFVGSPDHRRLLAEFGLTEDELPGGVTTAEIVSAGAS